MIHREAPICPGCGQPLDPIFKRPEYQEIRLCYFGGTFWDWDWNAHRGLEVTKIDGGELKRIYRACEKRNE